MKRPSGFTVLLTLGAALLVVVAAGLLYIYSGAYNVAATDDLEPIERWVFGTTATQSIRAHAKEPLAPPLDATPAMVQSGAQRYNDMCVMCHGAPGVEPSWLGQPEAMKPNPPEMSHVVEEFSDAELHWILENGIKHSGMPAMGPTHGDEAIREVLAFIKQVPDMSPQEYQAMTGDGDGTASDTTGGGHGGSGHSH